VNTIGPFCQGERPFPHVVTFTDDGGRPLGISGMTAKWIYQVGDGVPVIRAAVVSNGVAGEATYTWVDADFAVPGSYRAEMWCGTATGVKLASVPYRYYVRPAVAVPTFA
jgi:hypothetical protein